MYIKRIRYLDRTFRGYVVQQVTRYGRYHLYFESLTSFLVYYASIPKEERTFNEVIEDGPQKMRVDIDSNMLMNDTAWTDLIRLVCKVMESMLPDGILLTYDMSDANKRSCHVVVSGIHLEQASYCKYLCSQLVSNIPSDYKSSIDVGIYKSLQYFRMEGSTKLGTTRYKVITTRQSHTILDSLVSYVTNTKLMKIPIEKQQLQSSTVTLDGLCIKSNTFNVRKVQDNMILLNRVHPSVCYICKRLHTSENAYIVVTSDAHMYFRCWRSNQSLYIGIYNDHKLIEF